MNSAAEQTLRSHFRTTSIGDATTPSSSISPFRGASRATSAVFSVPPARAVGAAFVTANFFKVIGLTPELGRTFTDEEDKVGGPALAVISDRLWQRVFQRDPSVLGRSLSFHNQLYRVDGVMPPEMTSPQETDVWFPIMRRSPAWQNRAWHPMMFGWGRLKPGVTVEEARTEMKAIAARLEKRYPDTNAGQSRWSTVPQNLPRKLPPEPGVAAWRGRCRPAHRLREYRESFGCSGAPHGRVNSRFARPSGAPAAKSFGNSCSKVRHRRDPGGAFGMVLAIWSRDALVAMGPREVARFHNLQFDAHVLGFTCLLAGLTSIMFAYWPGWRSSHTNVQLALKAGGRRKLGFPFRTSDARFADRGEIALTLVFFPSAGLVLKSFARVQALSLGFEPRGLLTARIDLPFTIYSDAGENRSFSPHALLEKVRALPGVEKAALGANPPLLSGWQINFLKEGEHLAAAQQPSTECEVVSPNYFTNMGTTLLAGAPWMSVT